MPKRPIGTDVLTAARQRIEWSFDQFDRLYLSFSGGKDSTVMLHLVMDEARKRNRKIGVLFVDWECQFSLIIEHVKTMYELYAELIEPYWISLPITTWNGCSQFEPEWTAWDESRQALWVREKDPMSIQDVEDIPFWHVGITFEEFTPAFAEWYSQGKSCGCFVGIRAGESLNRFRTIARNKPMRDGKRWTTLVRGDAWNIYPIYDWRTQDDWTYFAASGKPYSKIYDRMHQAGMTLHQMRVDEPFGDTQRQSLWLYQIIEPQMWAKMCARVAGANTGQLYGRERGNILGNDKLKLPNGHTWKSFAELLLSTMPPPTSEHYKNKIAVYLKWYRDRGYPDGIPDEADYKLETYGKAPSWRRICKTLLRNDYWCRGIGFSPTKSDAYTKYMERMKKNRQDWGLFSSDAE